MTSPRKTILVEKGELRRKFNEGHYLDQLAKGSLRPVLMKEGHPAAHRSQEPFCTRSQSIAYVDGEGNEVGRVHQYLRPDGKIGGSGRPDPKQLVVEGTIYRLKTGN